MNPPNPLALSLPDALPDWTWATRHADHILAVLVAVIAALLVFRAWRRSEAAYEREQSLSPEDIERRDALADRRGRQGDDLGVLVVALAAAKLSSDGLRKLGADVMGLVGYWDWLPFLALDVAAYICGRRARRRSRSNEPPGLSGALVWVFAGISSAFSASEATTLKGQIARALWPLVAALLFELGSLEERSAVRRRLREAGQWIDRRLRLLRLFHPVELVRVALALAADAELSQADATRFVRIERAAHRLYAVRVIDERLAADGRTETRSRRKDKPKRAGQPRRRHTLLRMRAVWAVRQAQAAQTRVRVEDHDEVLAALRRLVWTRQFATVDFDDSAAVEGLRAITLDGRPTTAASPSIRAGHLLPYPGSDATVAGAGVAGAPASAGTQVPVAHSYPSERQVAPAPTPAPPSAPADGYPAAAQVGTSGTRVAEVPEEAYPPHEQVHPQDLLAGDGVPEAAYPSHDRVHSQAVQVHLLPPTRRAADQPEPGKSQVMPGRAQLATGETAPAHTGPTGIKVGEESARESLPDVPQVADAASGRAPAAVANEVTVPGRADDEGDDASGKRWTVEEMAAELVPLVNEAGDALTIGVDAIKLRFRCGQIKAQQARDLAVQLRGEARATDEPDEEAGLGALHEPTSPIVAQTGVREMADAAA